MARQKELESPTFRLGGGRSIQLSYWRISVFRPTLTRAAGLHRKGTAALF